MSVRNRLEDLKRDSHKLGKYREAIGILQDIGVQEILCVLSLPDEVDMRQDRGTEIAASKCHESLGYQKCIGDLFGLEELVLAKEERLVADFGANEKLGISESEAKQLI